jgi:steroid Delta-isomerase
MSSDKLADAQRIYDEWHAGFTTGDMARVAALYAEDAVFESPAVFGQFPDAEEGILVGRDKVRELFEFNLNNLSGAFGDLYRDTKFYADGEYLTWEYPRITPSGEQIDLFESIDIKDGLIAYHRVYWGWRGLKNLIAAGVRNAAS